MQIDRNAINKLLNMNDTRLQAVIRSLADNAGLDLSSFHIGANDIAGIRQALSNATDEDIARAAEQLNHHRRS